MLQGVKISHNGYYLRLGFSNKNYIKYNGIEKKNITLPITLNTAGKYIVDNITVHVNTDSTKVTESIVFNCTDKICKDNFVLENYQFDDPGIYNSSNTKIKDISAYDFMCSYPVYSDIEPSETMTYPDYLGISKSQVSKVIVPLFGNCGTAVPMCISNYSFHSCRNLKTFIVLSPYIKKIGLSSFYNCSSLNNVIADSIESIYPYCFGSCTSLTSLYLIRCEYLYDHVFKGCSNLETITLAPLKQIGEWAFEGTSKLSSTIKMSDTFINYIGDGAFYSSGISFFDLPIVPNNNSLGTSIFENCSKLTTVNLPDELTFIPNYTFKNCSSLSSITLPINLISIGSEAFQGSGLKSIVVPNTVTDIQDHAFKECKSLASLTLPNNIATIKEWSFEGCSSLSNIIIPNSVETIENGAFYYCTSATVHIPSTVTEIGDYAFQNVPHIYYTGTATGAPWGALAMN